MFSSPPFAGHTPNAVNLTLDLVLPPLIGGILIGLASISLMFFTGRIAGVSGIFAGSFTEHGAERSWRAAFVGGLLAGGVALLFARPEAFTATPATPLVVAMAGFLVGLGTRLGNGCTSGHGVCGLSRFSPRSFVATLTFIATGMIAVALVRAAIGGVPV